MNIEAYVQSSSTITAVRLYGVVHQLRVLHVSFGITPREFAQDPLIGVIKYEYAYKLLSELHGDA